MATATEVALQLRFAPAADSDLAGCVAQLTLRDVDADGVELLVPHAEPCEGRCGALVAASDLSGDRLGVLAWPDADGALARLRLPRGLWEAPRDDVDDEGDPVRVVQHHDVDRCRALRGGHP